MAAGTVARAHRLRTRDWLAAFGVAVVAALLLRAFCLQAFRIPTSSMEKNLLAGDFVLVSKLHYGPRLPRSVGLPLTGWYLPDVTLPHVRVPGFSRIRRGDVIVFNYPAEEGPVDRKTHYIKRVVGLPGETLSIRNKVTHIDGVPLPLMPGMQQKWVVRAEPGAVLPLEELEARGASLLSVQGGLRTGGRIAFEATRDVAEEVASWNAVASVEPLVTPPQAGLRLRTFPPGRGFSPDHYGPLYIPARGDTLHLTDESWPVYERLIRRYEGHDARRLDDGRFLIDGVLTDRYVVEQDYYFVMGDNRDNSQDSRVWGFVPMDHVVGKAVLVYFSWDLERHTPRFERILHRIR
ncbi:MAG: signal peptidase I [Rhodothermaceae bacterium]|nr:MAG: signal peptidase I [Rhodothermaceae bacterium]